MSNNEEKPVVVFVDDKKPLLKAYSRIVRLLPCEVRTYDSPLLAASEVEGIDNLAVFISDGDMPGMRGDELLGIVLDKKPCAVRMLMTGNRQLCERLSNTGLAHHYLEKPVETSLLKELIGYCLTLYEEKKSF